MKNLLLFFLTLTAPQVLLAQQKPQYSQYMINNYLLNPALTGIEDYADFKLGYRNQWIGVEGAPVNYYLSGHTKLGKDVNVANPGWTGRKRPAFAAYQQRHNKYQKVKPHHGIGGMLLHEQIGPFTRTEVNVSYAYHMLLSKQVKLAAGVSTGLFQQAMNADHLQLANPADNAANSWRMFWPNLTAGLWLYSSDFYIGVSGTQLLGNAFVAGDVMPSNRLYKHYFLTGAYKITPVDKVAIIPSVLVKWVQPFAPSVDYNLRVAYGDRLWGGISYRQRDSFAILTGITLSYLFDVSYSYDVGTSKLSTVSGGSHEIILGIRLHNRYKVFCPQNMW
jgi:type IX secretion system PorP/SprF family membrane protein